MKTITIFVNGKDEAYTKFYREMRKLILLLAIIMSIVNVSRLYAKDDKKQQPKQSTTTVNGNNARSILEMNNIIILLHNAHVKTMSYVLYHIDATEVNRQRLNTSIYGTPYISDCSQIAIKPEYFDNFSLYIKPMHLKEKRQLIKQVKFIRDNFGRLNQNCEAMNNYFTNKLYMSDSSRVQFGELQNQMVSTYRQIQDAWTEVTAISTVLADKAEIVYLELSPLSGFIVSMKKDLDMARNISLDLSAQTTDYSSVISNIQQLQTNVQRNRSTTDKDFDALQFSSSLDKRVKFYTTMDQLLETAYRLCALGLEEKDEAKGNKVYNTLQQDIDDTYTRLTKTYSTLQQDFNTTKGQ